MFIVLVDWSISSGSSRFRFLDKTLIFDGGQWPPIQNFLLNPRKELKMEAACKVSVSSFFESFTRRFFLNLNFSDFLYFLEGETDPLQIALKELKQRKIPIIIRKPIHLKYLLPLPPPTDLLKNYPQKSVIIILRKA